MTSNAYSSSSPAFSPSRANRKISTSHAPPQATPCQRAKPHLIFLAPLPHRRIEEYCYYYRINCFIPSYNPILQASSLQASLPLPFCATRSHSQLRSIQHPAPPNSFPGGSWLCTFACNSLSSGAFASYSSLIPLLPLGSIVRSGHDLQLKHIMPFGIHHKNRSKQALNDPPVPGSISPNSGSASPRASSQVQIFTPNPNNAGEDEARTTQQLHGQGFPQSQSQSRSDQPHQQQLHQQPYAAQSVVPDTDRRVYRNSDVPPPPTRSQSTRNSVGSAYQQQQHHQQQQQQQLHQQSLHAGSVDDLIVESRNGSRREHALPVQPPPPPEKQKSKSLFERSKPSLNPETLLFLFFFK